MNKTMYTLLASVVIGNLYWCTSYADPSHQAAVNTTVPQRSTAALTHPTTASTHAHTAAVGGAPAHAVGINGTTIWRRRH
jgi:hypothetical protein